MADEAERLEALEQFAIRLTRLAGNDWIHEETVAVVQEAQERPEARGALIATAELIAKGAAHQRQREARIQTRVGNAAAPTSPQSTVDANELLRRNALVLERFDREVGISKSYTTVITGAGYAGLLAIWSGFREHLDGSIVLFTGALIGISLAVFVFWEMMKVRLTDKASAVWGRVVAEKFNAPDFEIAAAVAQRNWIADSNALNRHQPVIFWTSTVTGFLAATVLIIASVVAASGLQFGITVSRVAHKPPVGLTLRQPPPVSAAPPH